jgi:leucyl/phenylalanyl-tRNA--protein transferase
MHVSEPVTPQLILQGYCLGIFPMADEDGSVYWYSPDPRCILEFDRFRVPRSLRQIIRRATFEVRRDTAFDQVVAACADRPEGTWISPQIRSVCRELHRRGFAHCVEAWQDGKLVGGLYGLAIGGAFFGESMFHHVPNASKVALVALMDHLQQQGFVLVDTQWSTPHLLRFGAVEIPREQYLERLSQALQLRCTFSETPGPTTGA